VLSSRDNPKVRRWQKLARDAGARRAERAALIEGPHLLEAYLKLGNPPHALIVAEAALEDAEVLRLTAASDVRPIVASRGVLAAIADTETPPKLIAEIGLAEAAPDPQRWRECVLLDNVQDAGNVGAILRSAAAFGFGDAVLGAGCADLWSPKVLRAAQGAHFALRLARCDDLAKALAGFGGAVLAAVPRGGRALGECDFKAPLAWLFGSEGQGLSAALVARATQQVTIPIGSAAESLNVAASAAICFYETARARARAV
jgi:TrmH family RNA methyltransferase